MQLARLGGSDGSELPFLFPGFPVWDHTIGGYQVIKKWLSYREKVARQGFTPDEVRHVTEMARRFKALIALQLHWMRTTETELKRPVPGQSNRGGFSI